MCGLTVVGVWQDSGTVALNVERGCTTPSTCTASCLGDIRLLANGTVLILAFETGLLGHQQSAWLYHQLDGGVTPSGLSLTTACK